MTESVILTEPVRVVANFGAAVAVLSKDGVIRRASPLSRVPQLVAGDLVFCEAEKNTQQLRVVELIERKTQLARPDRRGQSKPLASNISHLAIVCAKPPGIDQLLIDQFCVAADAAGMGAIIVLNKTDLLDDVEVAQAEQWLACYRQLGYSAISINTRSKPAIALLLEELERKSVALVGASGVGKSSIVQQILPDLEIRTGAISAATGFGAHTTTVTYWYNLPGEGALIDSPGVRQFTVAHLSVADVRSGFIEIEEYGHNCRFSNCIHTVEPNCAVREAVGQGNIAAWRYENYKKLLESCAG